MSPPRKGRRARGSGTVFWSQTRQRWVGRRTVGGRRIERSHPRQAECVRLLELASPPTSAITLQGWVDRWLPTHSDRPGTAETYRISFQRILPRLGTLRLADLTPGRVEQFARGLAKTHAPNTVRATLAHLGTALAAGVREGVLERNPVSQVRRPRSARSNIDPFTAAELTRIITAASRRPGTRLFALLAATGCRIGEAAGLDVGDYNPATGALCIRKTHRRRRRVDELGPPKSVRGTRTITVPEPARPALLAAIGGRKSGPLFVTERGRRPAHQTLNTNWRRMLARLEVRYRNPHQLRHAWATHALTMYGVADVAAYLGDHPTQIYATYCHPTGADPAEGMGRLLTG